MPRYKLTLAYDGTHFCGWQKQEPPIQEHQRAGAAPIAPDASAPALSSPPAADPAPPTRAAFAPWTPQIESHREGRVALRTVQGVLEQAVRAVVRETVEVMGASRTDSGVHARGQVAAFTCEPRREGIGSRDDGSAITPIKGIGWPLERGCDRLAAAINSRLPEDVLVVAAEPAAHDFDPVTGATSKSYSYTFHCSHTRPLWDRAYVHHLWHPRALDVAAMNAAAEVLVGEHDFAAFAAAGHGRLSTVRRVFSCQVRQIESDRIRLDISGNGFLWNMVRIIAGTLLQVGIGQRAPDDVRRILEGRDRTKAGPTVPGTGLCLEWIRYGGVLHD